MLRKSGGDGVVWIVLGLAGGRQSRRPVVRSPGDLACWRGCGAAPPGRWAVLESTSPPGGRAAMPSSTTTALSRQPPTRLIGVECSVFLGPWFLVVSGCVFLASQLVFDLVGGAVAER